MASNTDPFEWDAARYGELPLPHVAWGRGVLDRLALRGDERVLDLGCGTGRDARALLQAHPGCSVVGLDASAAMLDAAATTLADFPQAHLIRADLRGGFCLRQPVDAALSVAALHWLPDHRPVFASTFAALRPGGRFVAECGGFGNIARFIEALGRVTGGVAPLPWNFATAPATEQLLRDAGFVDARARLRPDAVRLDPAAFPSYLASVLMGKHLAELAPDKGTELVDAVAEAMGEPVIDYVRLEFEAVR